MFTCWFTGYIKRVTFVILHKPELKLWFVSESSKPMYVLDLCSDCATQETLEKII